MTSELSVAQANVPAPFAQHGEFGCSHLQPGLHQSIAILYMTAVYLQPWLQRCST